jgi:hypothetical protein
MEQATGNIIVNTGIENSVEEPKISVSTRTARDTKSEEIIG